MSHTHSSITKDSRDQHTSLYSLMPTAKRKRGEMMLGGSPADLLWAQSRTSPFSASTPLILHFLSHTAHSLFLERQCHIADAKRMIYSITKNINYQVLKGKPLRGERLHSAKFFMIPSWKYHPVWMLRELHSRHQSATCRILRGIAVSSLRCLHFPWPTLRQFACHKYSECLRPHFDNQARGRSWWRGCAKYYLGPKVPACWSACLTTHGSQTTFRRKRVSCTSHIMSWEMPNALGSL